MDNQEEKFVAPGYDENLHTCDQCTDTGISLEDFDYCKSCRMGPRIKQLDAFAQQLQSNDFTAVQSHDFTSAMRIVFRSTMRTEKALAAADKALLTVKCREQAEKIAELEANQKWVSVNDERKPEPGQVILVYAFSLTHGEDEDGNYRANETEEVFMGEYRRTTANGTDYHFDCFSFPNGDVDSISHWQPLPDAPQPPVDSKIAANNLNQENSND